MDHFSWRPNQSRDDVWAWTTVDERRILLNLPNNLGGLGGRAMGTASAYAGVRVRLGQKELVVFYRHSILQDDRELTQLSVQKVETKPNLQKWAANNMSTVRRLCEKGSDRVSLASKDGNAAVFARVKKGLFTGKPTFIVTITIGADERSFQLSPSGESPEPSVVARVESGSNPVPEIKKHNKSKKKDTASGGLRKMFSRSKNHSNTQASD